MSRPTASADEFALDPRLALGEARSAMLEFDNTVKRRVTDWQERRTPYKSTSQSQFASEGNTVPTNTASVGLTEGASSDLPSQRTTCAVPGSSTPLSSNQKIVQVALAAPSRLIGQVNFEKGEFERYHPHAGIGSTRSNIWRMTYDEFKTSRAAQMYKRRVHKAIEEELSKSFRRLTVPFTIEEKSVEKDLKPLYDTWIPGIDKNELDWRISHAITHCKKEPKSQQGYDTMIEEGNPDSMKTDSLAQRGLLKEEKYSKLSRWLHLGRKSNPIDSQPYDILTCYKMVDES
ncbi:uncharacterized protein IL334_004375 [Kwoniella shivajii]|uniref:Transcription activator GCR1-like domain-containing protein n=1 Tax=Kwoniella shivajii TaxID=564305 RepID=A0ABZ1D052_9TREE|nr:hypothetical protein IL334_004375 [Kwoniella shivajii]